MDFMEIPWDLIRFDMDSCSTLCTGNPSKTTKYNGMIESLDIAWGSMDKSLVN